MKADESHLLLVERVRRRDARAWEELIAQFEGRLTAFVQSRLGDAAASEDVVQETFLGFLTSLPNYDDATPLESFLFSIAAHKLIDYLRREGRRPALPLVDKSGEGVEPAGRARAASSLIRSREGRTAEEDVLADALQELIERWKSRGEFERLECIELLFVLGWTNKAAAQRLNISEQAVANHKYYVISQLKDAATRSRLRFDFAQFGIED